LHITTLKVNLVDTVNKGYRRKLYKKFYRSRRWAIWHAV